MTVPPFSTPVVRAAFSEADTMPLIDSLGMLAANFDVHADAIFIDYSWSLQDGDVSSTSQYLEDHGRARDEGMSLVSLLVFFSAP